MNYLQLHNLYNAKKGTCCKCGTTLYSDGEQPLGSVFVLDTAGNYYCIHCDAKVPEEEIYEDWMRKDKWYIESFDGEPWSFNGKILVFDSITAAREYLRTIPYVILQGSFAESCLIVEGKDFERETIDATGLGFWDLMLKED